MTPAEIAALAAKLEAAAYAYHNGLEPVMTDEAYDVALEQLRAAQPDHPFLSKVGAPVVTGDEVALPVPLPSLNKIKDQAAIDKWAAKLGAVPSYHVSAKLDGVSALWFPETRTLFTRGDGMRGRNISSFAPYFQGMVVTPEVTAVRGELIMRSDSKAIPAGKLARNIVAGALNRKAPDPALFAEIRFIAYELIGHCTSPTAAPVASCDQLSPEDGYKLLRSTGFETARAAILPASKMNADALSTMFSAAEAKSPYQMDGVVVAPNVARPATYAPQVRKGEAVNPADRVAWKTRIASATATARTIVRAVEWNVSHLGLLIPRVLFDPVVLAGATIGAATGLHGRWIYDNKVGPGAEIEVRRAGDVIPQIIAVHSPAPAGPAMPARYDWDITGPVGGAGAAEATAVHIKPVGDDSANASASIKLTHALGELGAENVGPGIVAKMYAAGYRTLGEIYAATPAEFAARLEGIKEKGAERIWAGLRVKQATWTPLTFLVASSTMPRGVGHSKLTPLLALNPAPYSWSAAEFKAARPAGLSDKTIDAIVAAIPDYLAWLDSTGFAATAAAAPGPGPLPAAGPGPEHPITVVFTGVRDRPLEAVLQAAGHTVADTVTKKTTHVVYADGPEPSTGKVAKAQELGIPVLSLSAFKTSGLF
jgi:DNA ligase (NAD+)